MLWNQRNPSWNVLNLVGGCSSVHVQWFIIVACSWLFHCSRKTFTCFEWGDICLTNVNKHHNGITIVSLNKWHVSGVSSYAVTHCLLLLIFSTTWNILCSSHMQCPTLLYPSAFDHAPSPSPSPPLPFPSPSPPLPSPTTQQSRRVHDKRDL